SLLLQKLPAVVGNNQNTGSGHPAAGLSLQELPDFIGFFRILRQNTQKDIVLYRFPIAICPALSGPYQVRICSPAVNLREIAENLSLILSVAQQILKGGEQSIRIIPFHAPVENPLKICRKLGG